MKIGIIGLEQTGKTSLFNALTGANVDLGYGGVRKDANIAMAQVRDERLDRLTAIFNPQRQVRATVEYVDVAGMVKGAARGGGFSPEFFSHLKGTDALLYVVRAFASDEVLHPEGEVDVQRDIRIAMDEFLFSDIAIIEGRLERLTKQIMKIKDPDLQREKELLERCHAHLENEAPLRLMELAGWEQKILRSFSFLTLMPLLVVVNIGEEQLVEADTILAGLEGDFPEGMELIPICASVEAEIAQLEGEDAVEFMAEYGLTQPASDLAIAASYRLMGYIAFFTVGEDECRAWTIVAGTHAPGAAGVVHSDMERGFIRAEVVHYDEFMAAGSMAEARHQGHFRLEGKEYVVLDGDIISFRFNV